MKQRIYYWSRKDAKAEVDFIYEINGNIYPIEVKSGINPRSKSLKSYDNQFSPIVLIRTTLLNFKQRLVLGCPSFGASHDFYWNNASSEPSEKIS